MRRFLGSTYSVEKTAPVPSKRREKVGPVKKLEKHPWFHKAFMQLGEEWNLKFHVLKQLEEFTCLIYGQNRESSMDGMRAKHLRKIVGEDEKLTYKSKIDLARLPSCHSILKPHLQRVNHRVALYNHADESILEKPNSYDKDWGWSVEIGVVLRCCVTKLTGWSSGHG